MSLPTLVEGLDYYVENGLYVFTAAYLLRRDYCCDSGCRHCPYINRPVRGDDAKPPNASDAPFHQ